MQSICFSEYSESLREMGACLLEKTALNDDEESGKVKENFILLSSLLFLLLLLFNDMNK
jgi:hypothetical protein